MKLRLILETVNAVLQTLSQRHGIDSTEITTLCKQTSHKYWKWVLKQWYDQKINLLQDHTRVQKALEGFQQAFSRLPAGQRDINRYSSVSQIEAVVEPILGISSSVKKHSGIEDYPGVEVVQKRGPFTTLKISDPESLCELGEGTKWCTRRSYKDPQHHLYIDHHGHIFTVFQNGRPVLQYTPDYDEIKDVDNKNAEDPKLLALISPPDPRDLETAYLYALRAMKDRWPAAEPYIMKDPKWAFGYALYVIGDRWPEAEPYIMKDPEWAFWYALHVIGDRWPEAEPYIMKDPEWACSYALHVIKKRWPEAEPYIMKNPQWAHLYAASVIKERWPEAEPYIAQDPWWATKYSHFFETDI